MTKKGVVASLFALVFSPLVFTLSYADNAEVLPKGVTRAGIESKFYSPIDERYNDKGDSEDVATDFNATLGSNVFSDLSFVETTFAMPTGSANVGRSLVSFEYEFDIHEFYALHGLTDRLTVGIKIPYWDVKNKVKTRLDASSATVGKSAIGVAFGAPLVPLAGGGPFGDAVPLTEADVQNLLGDGLDVNSDGIMDIPGFGYDRIESWSDRKLSDIEAGLRYQYLKTEDWRLAFTGAVRFPTGEFSDPDSLVDYPFGGEAWAFLFYFNNDYIGINNLVLDATFEYELILPHHQKRRVLTDVNVPITMHKENVRINPGDRMEVNASATYELLKGLSFYLYYEYGLTMKDEVSGDLGLSYEALEEETRIKEHVYKVGLSYSTIALYQEKKFPVPLEASVSYRNRFDGKNNVLASEYIQFGIHVYF